MERNQSERIRELLAGYLRDECSKEEKEELLFLLETPEGLLAAEAFMDKEAVALLQSRLTIDRPVSDRIFSRLKESIGQRSLPEEEVNLPFYKTRAFRVAASFTGVMFLAGLLLLLLTQNEVSTFTTAEGQKRTVILTDGSLVTLNGNSSVSFKTGRDKREVLLDGEAYFDVAHDSAKPFFVRTSRLEIKVLGTVFNVKSYSHEDRIETTLVSGKVVVKDLSNDGPHGGEIELAPNEQVVFYKETSSLAKAAAEVETNTSWRSGNLFFEDESAQTIFAELEKWYNVKITLDNQQRDCRFSMNIAGEPVSEVLGLFEKTTNVKVVSQGSGYRLEGKLCEE